MTTMYQEEKQARRYERVFGERVIRPLLPMLLSYAPAPRSGQVWLDWHAGTGLLSCELVKQMHPSNQLLIAESRRGFLRVLHGHQEIQKEPRCFIKQEQPQSLEMASGVIDVSLSHLRWQSILSADVMIPELCRVTRPGGMLLFSYVSPHICGSFVERLANHSALSPMVSKIEESGLAPEVVERLIQEAGGKGIQSFIRRFLLQIGLNSSPLKDPLLSDFLLPMWHGEKNFEFILDATSALNVLGLGQNSLVLEHQIVVTLAHM